MAKTSGLKGNPASKRMANPTKKAKRVRNKARNDMVREDVTNPCKSVKALRNWRHQEANRLRNSEKNKSVVNCLCLGYFSVAPMS